MRRVLVVCEASGDFQAAVALCERVLREQGPDWFSDYLDHSREHVVAWTGADASHSFVPWKGLSQLRSSLGVRTPLGRFDGIPGAPDALAARTALTIARHLRQNRRPFPIDAVLLVRDLDDQPERRRGLEQARDEARTCAPSMPVVIGAAFPEIEAWLIEGFEPLSKDEEGILTGLRHELGFDPRFRTAALTAKHDTDKKGCKRVLNVLTSDRHDRKEQCYCATSLETLKIRGQGSGLAQMLVEIERLLLPLCLVMDTSTPD